MLTGAFSRGLRGCHPLWPDFPDRSAGIGFVNPSVLPQPRPEGRFGLCPRSLAATDGIDVSFCSCGYLDVSVPRVRSTCPMRSGRSDGAVKPRRVSPFGHLRIVAWLPAPRSFSQAPASFVASRCQDIHHAPFLSLATPSPPRRSPGGRSKEQINCLYSSNAG